MSFLEVKNLNVEFNTTDGIVRAVNNVSFSVEEGKILAIVGESGSGKSQTVFAMMGLLDQNGRATGSVKFEDQEILNLSISELNLIRSEKIAMIFLDSFILILVLLASFYLRLGYAYWPSNSLLYLFIFGSPLIAIPIFYRFGLYKSIVRFIGLKSVWTISKAVSLYALLWGILSLMFSPDGTGFDSIPRSVILINWLLAIVLIGSSRLFARWFITVILDDKIVNIKRVVIYGAGNAGRQLSLALSQTGNYLPIAFIDDSNDIQRQFINSLEVYAPSDCKKIIKKFNVSEVFLALPSITRLRRREIIDFLNQFPIHVKILPSVSNIAEGKVRVDDLLEIDIADLLGRDSTRPNQKLLTIKITNKVVLITGAGGSIGSELCRQIIFLKPRQIILFENSEASLYHIEQELIKLKLSNIEITPVIGSITDSLRMKNIFRSYGVQTIYHAAAYKHVPLVEFNQSQGVINNSIGTMLAAKAAIDENVETFVLISTDKAVRPTSTMGASKRVAELVLQALSKKYGTTCLTMVRFGNVLDSSGSVIPLFKKQIKEGGPITVTDINMVRYFMTIPESVELVIQAGSMGKGGDVFVLDMGEPIKIYDLALKMIQLSGLQLLSITNPKGDIEIIFTGLRPGEKLYEELLVGNNVSETENARIMRAKEKMIEWEVLKPLLDQLNTASENDDLRKIRELLIEIVPEFKPQAS